MLLISPSVQGAHLIRAATSVSATSVPRLCVDQSVPEAVDHRRAIHYRPCDPQPTTVAYTAVSMLCMGVLSGLVGGHWKSRSVIACTDVTRLPITPTQTRAAQAHTLPSYPSLPSLRLFDWVRFFCCNGEDRSRTGNTWRVPSSNIYLLHILHCEQDHHVSLRV